MAKFSKYNPLDKLSTPSAEPTPAAGQNATIETPAEPQKPEKKKTGRPKTKTEPTKTINIAVPVSVLEKMEIAKVCYSNNQTQYINKLIEKDLEANFDTYKQIFNSLESFK